MTLYQNTRNFAQKDTMICPDLKQETMISKKNESLIFSVIEMIYMYVTDTQIIRYLRIAEREEINKIYNLKDTIDYKVNTFQHISVQ